MLAKTKGNCTAALAVALGAATIVPQMAFAAGTVNNLLSNIAGIITGIIAILAVVILVMKIKDYITGQGSIGQIVVPVLVCLLVIGLVQVFANVDSLQSIFGSVSETVVETTADVANDALG